MFYIRYDFRLNGVAALIIIIIVIITNAEIHHLKHFKHCMHVPLRSLLEDKKLLTAFEISVVTVLERAKDKAYIFI